MLKNYLLLVFCLTSFLWCSCTKNVPREKIDFYHWKTDFKIGENEKDILKSSHTEKLYVRFFDLVYNATKKEVLPVATLQMKDPSWDSSIKIIPVVYITNNVFKQTTDSIAIVELAKNVAWKIARLKNTHFQEGYSFDEVQIDCDWTLSTKAGYFEFLEKLKEQQYFKDLGDVTKNTPPKLSATLRLHQVKFMERTGIPPVDSVTLMAYNVGNLGDSNETNSIINNKATAQYINRLSEYPLSYNLALPIYSWAVLYRDDEIVRILGSLSEEQLTTNFDPVANSNKYVARVDTYIDKTFIYKGDMLRVEKVTIEELSALFEMIETAAKKELDIILYHINSSDLNTDNIDEIKNAL